jgi:nickel/cobalt exporter
MDNHITLLIGTAATIGFVHTFFGPDHYLPFVAMAKAGDWSKSRTLLITALCGLGHVGSSVVLGVLGVALGWTLGGMEAFESARGEWAAWALIVFGLVYGSWGLRRGIRNRPHTHRHLHADGAVHDHRHSHTDDHAHVHADPEKRSLTPWVLFTVFVLGPCEPLIPLLMVPAAAHSVWGLAAVAIVFGSITIATMLAVTFALLRGIQFVSLRSLERWAHALAGFAIFASGGAVKWLGL